MTARRTKPSNKHVLNFVMTRRRNIKLAGLTALLLALIGGGLVLSGFAATPASVYYGVFNDSPGGGLAAVADFEAHAGKPVAIVNWFQSWGSLNNSFNTSYLSSIRQHGSIPLVTWEPWDTSKGVSQPNYSLAAVASGQHDAYIRQWAKSAKAWGHPFFLRFAHEMNGDWYPWSEAVNGNTSGQYVAAWRHVHDIFDQEQVGNVTWVWCVNKLYTGSRDIATLYPGDKYVDWISLDAYNRGSQTGTGNQYAGSGWLNFSELIKPTYTSLVGIASGKPVMIAEIGTVEQGGSKADWFTKALKYELKTNYPRIKALVYFNVNKNYDNRIESSATSQAAFADGIGLSYYAGNLYANLETSPIQPLIYDTTTVDSMAPFVSIIEPKQVNQTVGQRIAITAEVQDKSGISRVEFIIDGQLICTEKTAPYTCYWTVPTRLGGYNLTAKAYDISGNNSTSTTSLNAVSAPPTPTATPTPTPTPIASPSPFLPSPSPTATTYIPPAPAPAPFWSF